MTADVSPRWRGVALAASVLGAACAVWLFAPLLSGYFLSDDFVPPVLFQRWQEQGALWPNLFEKFHSGLDAGENHFYRPLSYLTFGLQYAAAGVDAGSWMWANVAIHVANGVLVGTLGALLANERPGAREIAAGAMGCALFLFFAPSAEVVAWISGRFDAMATFFTLLSCIAFLRSRRELDAAWWVSLAAAECAFLSKESAAIVPFAIVLLALVKPPALGAPSSLSRWTAAIRMALPWLALAGLYLVSRHVFFGSFTQVYGGSEPTTAIFSREYWNGVASTLPAWLSAQFRPSYRLAFFGPLIAAQLAIVVFAAPRVGYQREALFSCAAIMALTLLLLLPHIGKLPDDGLGGRLLYQTQAFYGALIVVGLCHARHPYLAWGSTLALVLLNVGFMHGTLGRWNLAYREMRSLASEVRDLAAMLPPGEYALAIVPAAFNDIPFARNAQGGLMLPPVMPHPITSRVLVQIDEEVPQIPAKIVDHVVTTLRVKPVFDYMAGERVKSATPEYPTRVVCWDPFQRKLVPVTMKPSSNPAEWGGALRIGLRGSPCINRTLPRR